jgi:protease I
MAGQLQGKRVAALVTNGFEQSELLEPKAALEAAGARVDVISPEAGQVRGWSHKHWGDEVPVDATLDRARPSDYDAVLLPGGVMNPDVLRTIPAAVSFVREAFNAGKPIAAICHGPWTLIEAGLVDGLKMTSWPSLRTDLTNAGADWIDAEVVVDRGVVTSRKPADIPAFNRKAIEEFARTASTRTRPAPASTWPVGGANAH